MRSYLPALSVPLVAFVIFVTIQISSLISLTMQPTSDAFTTRILPISIIRDGDFFS